MDLDQLAADLDLQCFSNNYMLSQVSAGQGLLNLYNKNKFCEILQVSTIQITWKTSKLHWKLSLL